MAKDNTDRDAEIVRMRFDGKTYSAIGERFDISATAVRCIYQRVMCYIYIFNKRGNFDVISPYTLERYPHLRADFSHHNLTKFELQEHKSYWMLLLNAYTATKKVSKTVVPDQENRNASLSDPVIKLGISREVSRLCHSRNINTIGQLLDFAKAWNNGLIVDGYGPDAYKTIRQGLARNEYDLAEWSR